DIAFGLCAPGQHSGFERGYFNGDLVSLEIDEGVTRGHDVAFLLQPPRHGGFDDRFSERRDLYGEHSESGADGNQSRYLPAAARNAQPLYDTSEYNAQIIACEDLQSRRTADSISSSTAPTCRNRNQSAAR